MVRYVVFAVQLFSRECSVCVVFSTNCHCVLVAHPCHPMPPQPHDHFSIAAIYQSIHQPTSLVIPFYQGEQHIQDSNTTKTPSQCSFRIVNSSMTIDHSSLCHRKAVTLIHTWHMTYRRDSSVQPHSLDLVFEFVQIRLGLWI